MSNDTSIAIIGIAGRFPQASDMDTFWDNLKNGQEGITFFTDAELLKAGVSPQELSQPDYVKARAVLEDVELFDAEFFGYNSREAQWMDPQHRIFLEQAHVALENAGYTCGEEPLNVGVFAGCSVSSYLLSNLLPSGDIDAGVGNMQVMIGNDKDYLASRTSYKLNLTGPSLSVQTACSTSLTAVHVACQSLLGGECDMALAGGSCVSLPQVSGYLYQEGSIASPDGHCRPFDEQAKGTNGGSGVGVVLLKRFEDAITDGDHIYAVIKGSAINNDGADKVGFTAPSQNGQAAVIAEALALANIDASEIGYIEAHGTATPVGDPIEVAALSQVFQKSTQNTGYCAIGSIKSNLGHLDAAAGIAGLLKTILALKNRQIPASLNFNRPNPKIKFENGPFYVPRKTIDWLTKESQPRRAGVSSFGIGGSNVHVVLEEFVNPPQENSHGPHLLTFSAKSPAALSKMRENFARYLELNPSVNLADAAHTLQVGRRTFQYRLAIVATDVADAVDQLRMRYEPTLANATGVALLFTGQGVPLLNIGRTLYDEVEYFTNTVNECSQWLEPELGLSIARIIYPDEDNVSNAEKALSETKLAQPALLIIEYALTRLLQQCGIEPQALLGHSLGQYCAAVIANIFSIQDALLLVARRGAAMQSLEQGGMTAVQLSENDARAYLIDTTLDVAAINSHDSCVFAGLESDLKELEIKLEEKGIAFKRAQVNRAFHSSLTDPCLDVIENATKTVQRRSGTIPVLCNISGAWLSNEDACHPSYWSRHTRASVRFSDCLQTLAQQSDLQWLEIGPAPILSGLVRRNHFLDPIPHVPTFSGKGQQDFLQVLGQLWQSGISLNWAAIRALTGQHHPLRRIPLPTYPFEPKRHWIDPQPVSKTQSFVGTAQSQRAPLSKQEKITEALFTPKWLNTDSTHNACHFSNILFFDPQTEQSDQIIDQLTRLNVAVVTIQNLDELEIIHSREWDAIIYAWPLKHSGQKFDSHALEHSFYALLDVAQALTRSTQIQTASLIILTTGTAHLRPQDLVDPFQASVLGAARQIPKELSWLLSRCIDMTSDQSIDELLNEIFDTREDFYVALRGQERYCWSLEPLKNESMLHALPFKKKGVYWLTGGSGGVGMTLARYLAKNYQSKIAISSRRHEQTEPDANLVSKDWLHKRYKAIEKKYNITTVLKREGLNELLSSFSAALVWEYLAGSNLLLESTNAFRLNELENDLGIQEKYHKFFIFMIDLLVRQQCLTRTEDIIQITSPPEASSTIREKILINHSDFEGMIDFMQYCSKHYPQVLSGEISGAAVLYPDGSASKMLEAVAKTAEHSTIRTQLGLMSEWCRKLSKENHHKPFRMLEIGGGHGMLTDTVLKEIGAVEYYFTDIGKSFVDERIELSKKIGEQRVVCKVLDISRDPQIQGFAAGQFDWVLAMNVVHATPDIRDTLGHIRSLLKPGGQLVLLETVRQEDWVDIVWGLTPGWWAFNDFEIRQSSPLLSIDKWREVLLDAGFDDFISTSESASKNDAALMIARSNQTSEQFHRRIQVEIDELKALGSEVLLVAADVGHEQSMTDAKREIETRLGALDGVIQCAMVLEDSPLSSKTRAQAHRVLHPKVHGLQVLDKILADTPLDFLALFSSLSSLDPGVGQFDYAAANAVIDAYARSSSQAQRQVVSINWNRWLESGYVSRLNQAHQIAQGQISKNFTLDVATQWTLSEHQIQDVSLLPGTALIEYIVRFAKDLFKTYPIDIHQLQYVAPCRVNESTRNSLRLTLQRQDKNQFDFDFKLNDDLVPKAIGTVSQSVESTRIDPNLQSWLNDCTTDIDVEHTETTSIAQLGPRWQCLKFAKFNQDHSRAIALISLREEFLHDLDDHILHPALLDVATGFACSGKYLPFGMRHLVIYDTLPATFFSLVDIQTQDGHPLLNIHLVNQDGTSIACINGYMLRPVKERHILRQSRAGQIESLSFVEDVVPDLKPDEVEIEIIAAGLNFKDVLLASGLLPSGVENSNEHLSFGAECSGRIKRVGSRAQIKWHIGDDVIATAPGSLAEYVTVPSHQVFNKPQLLTFAQAACIPVAFATAYFALHTLGRIQPGHRVLIHSATGGVGLAAIQIAKQAGAEIFATAGNDSKRKYLQELGIPHVMDSRSTDFSQQIFDVTQGKGVDLVLNALSGPQMLASLDIVAKYGVFLELGKRDILANADLPLHIFDKGIGFFAIDFTPEHRDYADVIHQVLEKIDRGLYHPLPQTLYAMRDASDAFQFMLESKHIGKLVLAPDLAAANEKGVNHALRPHPDEEVDIANGLSDEQGWEVFTLSLQSRQSQIAVISHGSEVFLNRAFSQTTSSDLSFVPDLQLPQDVSKHSSIQWETPTQKKLAGIWQSVLGQEVTNGDDHFFELRGDSLLAISVISKVRQQFGVALEASILFTSPTLRELAFAIDQKLPPAAISETIKTPFVVAAEKNSLPRSNITQLPSGIVPLHHGGARKPLFLAPPIMGTLFPYAQFAQLLGKDQPVYGLAPRVDDHGSPVWKSMEEQAAFYVKDILETQPAGPYQLAGWSFGATVAFEVARQLESKGHRVSFFAAIDYPAQGTPQSSMLDFMRFFGASTIKNLSSYLKDYVYLRQKSPDGKKASWMGNIVENAVISKIISPEAKKVFMDQPHLPELMKVYRGNAAALAKYKPGSSYKGKIDLFRTEDHNMKRHNSTLEWETMTHGRVLVHKIGGTHMTILRSPYVEKLAELIKKHLN